MTLISNIQGSYLPSIQLPPNTQVAHSTPSNQNNLDFLYIESKLQDLNKSINILKDIENWEVNWDGHGAEKPNKKALSSAENLLFSLFQLNMFSFIDWKSPNITANQDGSIVFEWWGTSDKILVIYITTMNVLYLKAKNENIEDMEEGELNEIDLNLYQELFTWLK